MIAKFKKYLLASLLFLPVAAFADASSVLSYLTPPQGDFSLSLLQRVFGSIGGVLHGQGNQLVGTLVGVFNAFWVIAIGIAVLYVVWISVISAAQSGEMMGHGKKTVFSIMKIVIGFSLVAPSKSTGYSLAQNGVMWVVVQGVGLADRVSEKLYSYSRVGGQMFNPTPTTGADMISMLPVGMAMLKGQICMYKLDSILVADQKAQEQALKDAAASEGIIPPVTQPYAGEMAGYSINKDGTITMGSRNDQYNSDDASSHRFNSECGVISWNNIKQQSKDRLLSLNSTANQDDYKTSMTYVQQGVMEMFQNLLPISRALVEVNPKADNAPSLYADIANRGANALASVNMTYATLLDPLRYRFKGNNQDYINKKLDSVAAKGWIMTPLSVILPGISDVEPDKVPEKYAPMFQAVDPNAIEGGVFNKLSAESKTELADVIRKVNSDPYFDRASALLEQMNQASWNKIDFDQILKDYEEDKIASVMRYVDTAIWLGNIGLGAAQKASDLGFIISKGVIGALDKIADGACYAGSGVGGFGNSLKGGFTSIGKGDWDNVGDSFRDPYNDVGGCSPLGGVINTLDDAQESAKSGIDKQREKLEDFKNIMKSEVAWAKKGGMNNKLGDLSQRAGGPMGPLVTAVMTNMIGRGIHDMEETLFNPNRNALNSAIQLGGKMMHGGMNAFFQFSYISSINQILNMLIEKGTQGGGILGMLGGMALGMFTGALGAFLTYYVMFAGVFFLGGVMLYVLLPLTYIFGFAASALRWVGMVFINILVAPIFCFNLIRNDGEGMIGRSSERYLADVARTAITPVVLTLGAVAFLILFNIAFLVLTTLYSEFLPMLVQIYRSDLIIAAIIGISLLAFTMVLLWIGQILSSLCTAELVQAVEHSIGDGIQRMTDHSPADQIRQAVTTGGQHISGTAKQLTSSGKGGAGGGH